MDIYSVLDELIEREGGYVDHPHDRGGPTNMGITHRTLAAYRGGYVTVEDVQNLTKDEAVEIYIQQYWLAPGLDTLDTSDFIAEHLLDMAVHHGPGNAVRMLQSALRTKEDGIIGPMTRGLVSSMPNTRLAARLVAERLSFIGRLITKDPRQASFAHGWMNRMGTFVEDIPLA